MININELLSLFNEPTVRSSPYMPLLNHISIFNGICDNVFGRLDY